MPEANLITVDLTDGNGQDALIGAFPHLENHDDRMVYLLDGARALLYRVAFEDDGPVGVAAMKFYDDVTVLAHALNDSTPNIGEVDNGNTEI
jgi:hypothetical protein